MYGVTDPFVQAISSARALSDRTAARDEHARVGTEAAHCRNGGQVAFVLVIVARRGPVAIPSSPSPISAMIPGTGTACVSGVSRKATELPSVRMAVPVIWPASLMAEARLR